MWFDRLTRTIELRDRKSRVGEVSPFEFVYAGFLIVGLKRFLVSISKVQVTDHRSLWIRVTHTPGVGSSHGQRAVFYMTLLLCPSLDLVMPHPISTHIDVIYIIYILYMRSKVKSDEMT